MPSITSPKLIAVLRHLFAKYSLPEQLVSDNGPQFTSAEFAHFMRVNGIKHIRCSPYHPASNGGLLRDSSELSRQQSRLTLQHHLENFLLTYRTSPHATTDQTPSTLFLGREVRTRWDLLKPSLEKSVNEKQASQMSQHDAHAKERESFVGQQVMTKNLRPCPNWIPGAIVQRLGPVSFLMEGNKVFCGSAILTIYGFNRSAGTRSDRCYNRHGLFDAYP